MLLMAKTKRQTTTITSVFYVQHLCKPLTKTLPLDCLSIFGGMHDRHNRWTRLLHNPSSTCTFMRGKRSCKLYSQTLWLRGVNAHYAQLHIMVLDNKFVIQQAKFVFQRHVGSQIRLEWIDILALLRNSTVVAMHLGRPEQCGYTL